MMLNFNKNEVAATEVLEIIKHLNPSEKNKIPKDFMDFLEKRSIDSYKVEIDFSNPVTEIKLKPETRSLLAIVYKDYLCNEEEKIEFEKILKENEKKYLNELSEKYNPDNLFKKKEIKVQNEVIELERIKKKSFIQKIVEKIKLTFKIKK